MAASIPPGGFSAGEVDAFGGSHGWTSAVSALLRSPPVTVVFRQLAEQYNALDSAVSTAVFDFLKDKFGIVLTAAELTGGLPLAGSPIPMFLLLGSYLGIVLGGVVRIRVKGLKPREKEPGLLRAVVVVHNLVLFALSLYMCCGIVIESIRNRYSLWGNPYQAEERQMAFLIYIFYVSKYLELGDTLIMVVKRNVRQVSLLHVYHHCSITLIWWAIAHHAPGGEAYFSAALNSGVHVAMYGYYCLAALVGKDEKVRQKYLFWGRYVTQLQMIQFGANIVQACWNLHMRTPYPLWFSTVLLYYMMSLLALFAHFYINKYIFRSRRSAVKAKRA